MPEDIAMITAVYISSHPTGHSSTQTCLTQDSYISYLRCLALFGNGIVPQCQPMCHTGSFHLCQDSVTYPLNKGKHGCALREINLSVLFVTEALRGWYINV